MSSGTSLSAAEQARSRRERREQRILSQGNSRLEKIAGLQGGAPARETLHPDPPEVDIAEIAVSPSSGETARSPALKHHDTVAGNMRDIASVDGGDEDPFSMFRSAGGPFGPGNNDITNDQMMNLLLNNPLFGQSTQSAGGSGSGGPGSVTGSDDLQAFAQKINQQLFGAMNGGSANGEQSIQVENSTWKWKLARVVGLITILGYLWTQLEDYHFSRSVEFTSAIVHPRLSVTNLKPIFYTFMACSFSLQAIRLILEGGRPLPGSMVATIGSFLPHPFGTALVSFARYRLIFTDVLEDFAALIFGLALMYWFKTE